ncbi:MAG: alpha/beta hydrolase, partial [Acidobacteria bacterium]|nr:alpha/beta hydrolase [Acidobacteriota bacterium]
MTRGIHNIFFSIAVAVVLSCVISGRASASSLEDHTITVENLRLHYVESGEQNGRTLVLIHGNAGKAEDVEFGAIDALTQRYHVIAIDRPGHGQSDRSDNLDTVDTQAVLLHQELQQLRISKPILVGHSWGGSLALAYALKYPNDLGGLVLLAPA